ncbi:MAG: hypothetical protein MUP58_01765 [Candidatus Nanohaloarchaeota archaeon QJJ-9]|nr:hypothetical protein [Candidatus Nanohaloarchaeota archaeon QJJ-9]
MVAKENLAPIILLAIAVGSVAFFSGMETGRTNLKQDIKAELVEKYQPGTCFGMPGGVSEKMIEQTIEQNKKLSDYIKNQYNLQDKQKIYNKIKQFQNINLNRTGKKYDYILRDGNCCTITTYNGTATLGEGTITIQEENRSSENVPC